MQYLIGILGLIVLAAGAWGFNSKDEQIKQQQVQQQNKQEVKSNIDVNQTDELEDYQVAEIDFVNAAELISAEVGSDLSQAEIDGLMFMREEEKLARDVYLALYEYWNISIFNNIANSESTHMEAVLTSLKKYDLTDPASNKRGEFVNSDLQKLYDQLVVEGKKSRESAFTVGAKIEDLDIRDLELNINATSNSDILIVYESLQRGSRNHLRALNRQLLNETGSNYVPEFISEEEFNAIIASSVERGSVHGQGNQNSKGTGQGGGRGQGRN